MAPQAKYWLLTVPVHCFTPYPVPGTQWIRGQLELGAGGFLHWQIYVEFERKLRLSSVKQLFSEQAHCEPSRSSSAIEYVWKEDTRVPETQFEFGARTLQRNQKRDWEEIWQLAKAGNIEEVEPSVR